MAYAQNRMTNSSKAIRIQATSPMRPRAMLASRNLRCASHQHAGTKQRHRYTRTHSLGFLSRAVVTIVVFASLCGCRTMQTRLPVPQSICACRGVEEGDTTPAQWCGRYETYQAGERSPRREFVSQRAYVSILRYRETVVALVPAGAAATVPGLITAQPIRNGGMRPSTGRSKVRGTSGTRSGK